eukprot:scaffold74408_cov27-Phaeocystis_antarctica.AAC.2
MCGPHQREGGGGSFCPTAAPSGIRLFKRTPVWGRAALKATHRGGGLTLATLVHLWSEHYVAAKALAKAAPGPIAESSFKLQAAVHAFRGVPQGSGSEIRSAGCISESQI